LYFQTNPENYLDNQPILTYHKPFPQKNMLSHQGGYRMNNVNTQLSFSAYMNNVAIHYYEDFNMITDLGQQFNLNLDQNYFLALSFLYPSDQLVSYEEKLALRQHLQPIIKNSPVNESIHSEQFILVDKGVLVFLISPLADNLQSLSLETRRQAVAILETTWPDCFIRIGIGTIEAGITGIQASYYNALQAVIAGEAFKKERRVLDYIGMEIYSTINAMVIAHGKSLISTILRQLTEEEQLVLGKYYKCKTDIAKTAESLQISDQDVSRSLNQIKERTGLDVNDTEDSFKLNFIMIAKRVLEKEKQRR